MEKEPGLICTANARKAHSKHTNKHVPPRRSMLIETSQTFMKCSVKLKALLLS